MPLRAKTMMVYIHKKTSKALHMTLKWDQLLANSVAKLGGRISANVMLLLPFLS